MYGNRAKWLFLGALLTVGLVANSAGVQADELSVSDLITLIDLGIDEASIVSKIEKDGIDFELGDETLERFKSAKAPPAVLDAIRAASDRREKAASSATPAPKNPPITYQDVLKLVQLGIDEDAILKRLGDSITAFQLSAEQVSELKQAGATDRILSAMQNVRPASVATAEIITDLVIILDSSGSMREKTADGQIKMDVAKKVVSDLVKQIPDGVNLGFVVYGHEVYGPANDSRNCEAVAVKRPLAPLDSAAKAELARQINELQPVGATPIAYSLQVAGKELSKRDAYCGVLLLTDGLETCNGDPTAQAAALAANPKLSFGVSVVGFDVKSEESRSLKAIADAGHGQYYDAGSAAELTEKMSAVAAEIQTAAKRPDTVNTSRRAVKILAPRVEMPEMAEVVLVETEGPIKEARLYKIGSIAKYGEELRIPSATTKYDLVWYPKEGEAILMVKGLTLPERKVIEIKPEDHVGFIKVNGQGTPKNIYVTESGQPKVLSFSTQRTVSFGQVMVVPVGKYNVLVDDNLIEQDLQVEPGKLYELE